MIQIIFYFNFHIYPISYLLGFFGELFGETTTHSPVLESAVGPTVSVPSGYAHTVSVGANTFTFNLSATLLAIPLSTAPAPQETSRMFLPSNRKRQILRLG